MRILDLNSNPKSKIHDQRSPIQNPNSKIQNSPSTPHSEIRIPQWREPGQAEIQHLHVPIVAHHDVVGFDVAVRDARGVRDLQSFGELATPGNQRINRHRFRRQRPQRSPGDQFHDNKAAGVAFADFVDGDDVRMIERGNRQCFLLEAAQAIGIVREFGGQELYRDFALQPRIFRQPDFAHAAFTQARKDSVLIDAALRGIGQRIGQHRGGLIFSGRLINSGGDSPGLLFDVARGKEAARLLARREQRFDFRPQRRVSSAGTGKKGGALVRCAFQSRLKKRFDFSPPVFVHRLKVWPNKVQVRLD